MTKRKPITDGMKWRALILLTPCWWCGFRFLRDEPVEWDHYHAIALGGKHEAENLRPLHKACHAKKTRGTGATTAGSDIGKIKKMRHILTGKMEVRKKLAAHTFDTSKYTVMKSGVHRDAETGRLIDVKPKRKFPKGKKLRSRNTFQKRRVA